MNAQEIKNILKVSTKFYCELSKLQQNHILNSFLIILHHNCLNCRNCLLKLAGIFLGTRHAPLALWNENWCLESRTEAPEGTLKFWLTRHNGLSLKCSCNVNSVILKSTNHTTEISAHFGESILYNLSSWHLMAILLRQLARWQNSKANP